MKKYKESVKDLGDLSFWAYDAKEINANIYRAAIMGFFLAIMIGVIIGLSSFDPDTKQRSIYLIIVCVILMIIFILLQIKAYKKWKIKRLAEIEKYRNKLLSDIEKANIELLRLECDEYKKN